MNRFLDGRFEGGFERPKRVFARLDSAEPLDEGNRLLAFDAINAGQMGYQLGRSAEPLVNPNSFVQRATICAVTIPSTDLGVSGPLPDDSEADGSGWFRFSLVYDYGGPASVYPSLFATPEPAYLYDFEALPPSLSSELDLVFSLDHLIAPEPQIRSVLDRVGPIENITIYDVGQGSAAGLNRSDMPIVYCDFGGGVLGHQRTFPEALEGFCLTKAPLVILSHWDWDHWSSASRFDDALSLCWIAPRQAIGPTHASFAASILEKSGSLRIWSPGLAGVDQGFLRVLKCVHTGRNHSGLAVEARGPEGERPILLPGDARYSAIPGALDSTYTSIVAPHHGADMKLKRVPQSTKQPHSRLVYSRGEPNDFEHPRMITKQNHAAGGWPHFNSPADNVVRDTSRRSSNGLGHIQIGWRYIYGDKPVPCGGKCSLAPQQS